MTPPKDMTDEELNLKNILVKEDIALRMLESDHFHLTGEMKKEDKEISIACGVCGVWQYFDIAVIDLKDMRNLKRYDVFINAIKRDGYYEKNVDVVMENLKMKFEKAKGKAQMHYYIMENSYEALLINVIFMKAFHRHP